MKWIEFIRLVLREFSAKNCLASAASLAFTTLLALVPLLFVFITIITAFPVFSSVSEPIKAFVIANFVPNASQIIQAYIGKFADHASKLSALGISWLIITAMMLMLTIEHAFNDIWHIRARRKTLSVFLRYWAILTLTPICIAMSFLISAHVSSAEVVSGAAQRFHFIDMLLNHVPLILGTGFFAIVYMVVPNCPVRISHALISGLMTMMLLSCAKSILELYLEHFPSYTIIYGAFAVIPLSLLWVHFAWTLILLGAVVCHNLGERHRLRPKPAIDGFTHAFKWLGYLWQAQRHGKMLSLKDLTDKDKHCYEQHPVKILDHLINAGLVTKTSRFRYVLQQDLHEFSLESLAKLLPWPLPKVEKIEALTDNGPEMSAFMEAVMSMQPSSMGYEKPLTDYFDYS